MPAAEQWSFFSLIYKGDMGHIVQTLSISECELNILWHLGRKGPKSIYDLAHKTTYYLPKLVRVLGPAISREKTEEKIKYHYPFVHKTVKVLRDRDLVRISKDSSGPRTRKMVELTFSGLMLYLQGSTDKRKVEYALKHYSKLLPFSKRWSTLKEKLGSKEVINAFNRAVASCTRLTKTKIRIRPLQLKFKGFVRNIFISTDASEQQVLRERDEGTSNFLKSKEDTVLRDSYIAYLAVHDITKLAKKSRKQVEELIPKLDSERELEFFEKGEGNANSLFKGDRLRKLFPKYAQIGFFFTGMFMENLLWHEKTIRTRNETYDFNVEYLFE